MKEVVTLRQKMQSYLTNDDCVYKKAVDTKKCVIKREMKFEDYKKCRQSNKTILRSQQSFRSEFHKVFKEKINKTAFSANDDKRI